MKKRGELVPRRLISGKYDHNRWEEGIKRIITPIPVLLFLARERERKKEGGKKEKRRASLLEEIRLGAE